MNAICSFSRSNQFVTIFQASIRSLRANCYFSRNASFSKNDSNSAEFFSEQTSDDPLKQTNQQKMVRVAVIGAPNAGKSTFINMLTNRKVCFLSSNYNIQANS